jgi:thiamine-phosphate pyrophosphorylase
VRYAAEATSSPFFAIGGIGIETIDEVLESGAMRVAVSSAILKAERPRQAARALRDKLDQIRHIQPFGEMKA